ncbi:MAG: hypothetical protein ACREIF_13885 [Chthoniobacterales bacterium]
MRGKSQLLESVRDGPAKVLQTNGRKKRRENEITGSSTRAACGGALGNIIATMFH